MNTFLLIIEAKNRPKDAGVFLDRMGLAKSRHEGRYFAQETREIADGWVAVQPVDARTDYSEQELAKIEKVINEPYFYLVEGRNGTKGTIDRFILSLNPSGSMLVDNDHGVIEDISVIKEKIRSGLPWWR